MIKLQYLGHCCFLLEGDDGAKILIDPMDPTLGYQTPAFAVDLVLVTRPHMAHNAVSLLPGSPAIFMGAGERKVGRIHIQGIALSPGDLHTIFVWRYQGLRFCHLGALHHDLDTVLKNQIGGEIDVLFLPVGGAEYLQPYLALRVMQLLQPRLTIPMAYRTHARETHLLPLSEFLEKNSVPVIEAPQAYALDFRSVKALEHASVIKFPVLEAVVA